MTLDIDAIRERWKDKMTPIDLLALIAEVERLRGLLNDEELDEWIESYQYEVETGDIKLAINTVEQITDRMRALAEQSGNEL